MATNYQWLLEMDGAERKAWFDAEHVENANDTLDANTVALDAKYDGDSREKLEDWAQEEVAEKWAQTDMEVVRLMDDLLDMLDRQAAITEAKMFDHYRAELERRDKRERELTAERDNLAADLAKCEAERNELSDELIKATFEREKYRKLLIRAIDNAFDTTLLLDEGAA